MASILLHCSICPKKPNFSDTSHLLTHVSSKGHLSHLHKLQVRSHQEIGASHQLAVYDHWYQQHGVAQLLSERMLQKEAKKATQRVRSGTTQKRVKKEPRASARTVLRLGPGRQSWDNLASPLDQQSHKFHLARHPQSIGNLPVFSDGDSEYDSSPIKVNRKRMGAISLDSSLKRFPFDDDSNYADADCAAEDDPTIIISPDTSKLKGVLWPGMDLFDAASAEMRRRRNQKKDGRTLQQMEINSKIVEPTEVIFSPGGTMRKQRRISGMVEDSSPLKGETPVPRKPARRRRPALAETSGNILRDPSRIFHLGQPRVTSNIRDLEKMSKQTWPYLLSSSTNESCDQRSRFSQTEDENMELQLTVGNLKKSKRDGNWKVFNDDRSIKRDDEPFPGAAQTGAAYPGFMPGKTQGHRTQSRQHNPFLTNPWLQPYHQHGLPYSNFYEADGDTQLSHSSHQGLDTGKENTQPSLACRTQTEEHANPLGWPYGSADDGDSYRSHVLPQFSAQMRFSGSVSHNDSFEYPANPLNTAFQQVQNQQESTFTVGGTVVTPYDSFDEKREIHSPDGTISDQDGIDYVQGFLATSDQ